MANLQNDIRQLFSYGVLTKFNRLEDSEVNFTFDSSEVYLSCFDNALNHIDEGGFKEYDEDLAAYARVFENFVKYPTEVVSKYSAGLISSVLYWLAGYSGSSVLLANAVLVGRQEESDYLTNQLLRFLSRKLFDDAPNLEENEINLILMYYVLNGNSESLDAASEKLDEIKNNALEGYDVEVYVSALLYEKVLDRYRSVSIWSSLLGNTSADLESWRLYMKSQVGFNIPLYDLWPSQRVAIKKGLLDGESSITLRMPTSAGKTKMTELAFVNDLMEDPACRCLYLAPFRALVAEVESSLGEVLPSLGYSVASLYGGSDANILEAELAEISNVIVATPEKIEAVLSLAGKDITEFNTVVLDEGHLLDSISRGANYELQLAELRAKLEGSRSIFLSAVLPNSSDVAGWLGGSVESLAQDDWQPTTMRIGVVVWPKNRASQLRYVSTTGQNLTENFFVHKIIEEDKWKERNPETNRQRTHYFPRRRDNGRIAGSLAFTYAKSGPVIIYARRPDWAESITKKLVKRLSLQKPIETNLVDEKNRESLEELSTYLKRLLGEYSILPEAVKNGFAFHHGKLPQSIRLVIEEEYRQQSIRLLIATNTLAQGVNLPAKTVIVHSFPETDASVRDFWNLAGRAGRALKESEGEIIILGTGNLKACTVRNFLNKANIEPIESRILSLVKKLVTSYGGVSLDSISSLLADESEEEKFDDVLTALDMHLLGLLVEDLNDEAQCQLVDNLADNLLATYQAEAEDLIDGLGLGGSVKELINTRKSYITNAVPEYGRRKRFSMSGLDVDSCLKFENDEEDIVDFLLESPELNEESFSKLVDFLDDYKELGDVDTDLVKSIGFLWLNGATYSEIYEQYLGEFDSFNAFIGFVENAICYRVPWAISGFLRLVESIDDEDLVLPDWIKDFAQLLRYGVSDKKLMWIMSVGITDRDLAAWLLEKYNEESFIPLRRLKSFVGWAIAGREEIVESMNEEWPVYFSKLFNGIVNRYEKIQDALNV